MGSCRIVNIKVGRVGGMVEARKIHDTCERAGLPLDTFLTLAIAAMAGLADQA